MDRACLENCSVVSPCHVGPKFAALTQIVTARSWAKVGTNCAAGTFERVAAKQPPLLRLLPAGRALSAWRRALRKWLVRPR